MKKYDPYKRLILFIASFINILLLCLLFAAGWYRYYAGTMYVITFYRRGHYVVIALYGMMLLFFSNMYGSLKIGQYRRIEVLLSQFLSLLLTNILFYFIISLLDVYKRQGNIRKNALHKNKRMHIGRIVVSNGMSYRRVNRADVIHRRINGISGCFTEKSGQTVLCIATPPVFDKSKGFLKSNLLL